MMYKCSGSLVLGGDQDHEVLTYDRVAASPYAALEWVVHDLLRQLSVQSLPVRGTTLDWNLICWVDPVLTPDEAKTLLMNQRAADRDREKELQSAPTRDYQIDPLLRTIPAQQTTPLDFGGSTDGNPT